MLPQPLPRRSLTQSSELYLQLRSRKVSEQVQCLSAFENLSLIENQS